MKTYKVLEAHQGDKFYKPGDPETGTRVADPNAVQHLVALGLLEEVGDAPADVAAAPAGADSGDQQAQIAALTQERDEARADLGALRDQHGGAEKALTEARQQIAALTQERDEARAAIVNHQTVQEREVERVRVLENEIAELKAASNKPAGRGRGAN